MWTDTYTTALGLERATAMVARALSVAFEPRHSVLDGDYFRAVSDDPVIEIRMNYAESDELVHPDVPEGVFVTVEGQADSPLRATLADLRYLTRLDRPQVG